MTEPPTASPVGLLAWIKSNAPAAKRRALIDLFLLVNTKIDQIEAAKVFNYEKYTEWLQPWYALADIVDPDDRLDWPNADLSLLGELVEEDMNQMELF